MEEESYDEKNKVKRCFTKNQIRDHSITIRLDKAEYEIIKKSSSFKNLNISTFCRQAIMDYISVSEESSIDQEEYFGKEESLNSVRNSIKKDTQKLIEETMSILFYILPSSEGLSKDEKTKIRDKRMKVLMHKFKKVDTLTEFKKDE